MTDLTNYSNSEIENIIDEWVKGEKDRYICKRKIIDRWTYERIAEDKNVDLSARHTQTIYYHWIDVITAKLDERLTREWAEKVCLSGATYVIFCDNQ